MSDEMQQIADSLPTARHLIVPVDDAHPFDLDSYIANYSGNDPPKVYP